ncbi:uncharacterized protein PAC_14958 [Phialocephala subalpina]|uniref:Fe-containing alcohol dehydrogenase-like C-terminal domain-containing protein n=1 Tax=Phialocephala subalpina TaxID=576137 RepID=A0A1L7XJ69_9HELO|nr:uncharacterized protein PAC_14958 [Phialocephala subalpina]
MSQEVLRAFPDKATPLVRYGLLFTEACSKHVQEKFKASRIYLITGKTPTNNVHAQGELVKLPRFGGDGTASQLPANPPTIPIICIPTTLSGGEYSTYAGAVDHYIETLASLHSMPEVDESVTKSLKCLIPGLLNTKLNAGGEGGREEEVKAREECQIGAVHAILLLHRKVSCGASHGIRHMLGPMFHVGHGETSCILLPAACKFNSLHGGPEILARQQLMKDALWSVPEAKNLFGEKGLGREVRVDQLLDVVIRELGLKRRLSEVGVVERMDFERLADASLRDPFLVTNVVIITTNEHVLEISEVCASGMIFRP